ncbi:MAG: hypothetical protein M0T77_11130, partial [Actinomycetota bacterium]|nr:hypothetical protein [Actinomycetota bacterium]
RFWIVAAACGAVGFTLYQISAPKLTPETVRTAAVLTPVQSQSQSQPQSPSGRGRLRITQSR